MTETKPASARTSEDLIHLFTQLVRIPGVSRNEQNVAEFVRDKLNGLPYRVEQDAVGAIIQGDTGNLIIKPEHFDASRPVRIYMAHMDTVRDTSGIQVIRENGRIQSDGSSQLGADNRAGMAVLLSRLLDVAWLEDATQNYMVVFTVCEESGLLGATHLDFSGLDVEGIFVFDSARRPGGYIRQCAGMYLFNVEIRGRAAHSAVNPDEGINAIMVAAEALGSVRTGRLGEMTTVNIGRIEGGETNNVVAPVCRILGEVRATDMDTIAEILDEIENTFTKAAKKHGAKVLFDRHKEFAPYTHDADSVPVKAVEAAIRKAGLNPDPLRYTGGSDANVLNERGFPAVNLGIGAQKPHADDEFILEEDLIAAWKIAGHLLGQ